MFLTDWAIFDALIDWMGHGLFNLAWWQVLRSEEHTSELQSQR